MLEAEAGALPLSLSASLRADERGPAKAMPGGQPAVRDIAYLQRTLGNRAVQRFLAKTVVARKPAPPPAPTAAPAPTDPQAAGDAPVAGVATAPLQPQAPPPPASPGQPAGSGPPTPPGAAGGPGGGGAGPLDFLKSLEGVAPSDLPVRLAAAGQSAGAALSGHRSELEGLLPSRPAPSGMAPGTEVAPPAAPDVPEPDVNVSADGAGDPGVADQVRGAGTAAVGQSASGMNVELPDAAQTVRPTAEPGELPAATIDPPQPLASEAPATRPEGLAQKALDANLSFLVGERIASILAPASAASVEHSAAVSATHTDAERQVSAAESSTKGDQEAATSAADKEIRQLHAGWSKEKSAIVEQHQSTIRAESQQAKATANQAIAEANASARAKADEAEKTRAEGEEPAPSGLWDRARSVGKSVLSGIGNVVGSVVGVIKGILAAVRQRVMSLLSRLKQVVQAAIQGAVKAIRAGVQRVAGAIASALRKAQAFVTRLAKALFALATRIWQAAARRLTQLWNALQTAARKALAAARSAVQAVTKALGMIREILKVFGNKTYAFIADAVKDPEGKIVGPIVAKAAPLAAGVPAKADELAKEHGAASAPQAAGPEQAAASPPIQRTIQRAPAAAPAGEGFWDGVWRHMAGAGADFKANWGTILAKAVLGILLYFPMLMEELPELWTELKGLFVGSNDGMDRLDHFLGVCRHVVNIFAGSIATLGVWSLILAWLGGPIAEGFTLAGYEAVSAGIIAADLVVGAAQMAKSAAGATRTGVAPEEREGYLSRFASGGIGFAITLVMVALGAIAVRFARAVRAMKAASVEAKAVATGGKAPNPIGEPVEVRPGGPIEPRPLEYPYSNPPNMRVVPPGAPLDLKALNPALKYLWVVDADGNFRFAPEGQNTSDFMKPLPPDKAFKIKHGDLTPGPEGLSRGPARAGGEMHVLRDIDGNPTDMWNINNDSSYTFARVDANGAPLPWAPAESVEAVRNQLVAGGTNPNKLVTTDVLAGDRLKAGKK